MLCDMIFYFSLCVTRQVTYSYLTLLGNYYRASHCRYSVLANITCGFMSDVIKWYVTRIRDAPFFRE